jgi:hypothetical protein
MYFITFVVLAPLLRNQVTALGSLEAARAPEPPRLLPMYVITFVVLAPLLRNQVTALWSL